MKKLKTLTSYDLGESDDYANALMTLKTLRTNERSLQKSQQTMDSEDKLNKIFIKTKTQKMRDIFIEKLKRNISTNKPQHLKKKSPIKGPCGLLVNAIEFPERLSHIIIFTNVIVVLILIVLATFEGFIDNFRLNKNFGAVLALKIICLIINSLYFILKCSNKSFGSGQNLTYIHEVLIKYAQSGRLFLDFITIVIEIATLIFPNVMQISQAFFFFLIIVLFFTLADLMRIQAAYLHSEQSVLIWGLVKICLANIMFAHIVATIILGMARLNTQKNWMTKIQIAEQSWDVIYFYSFYWGITIMMTVGFGDVLPNNHKQVIITSFIEMFSCILLGYNISEIGHLISQLREKNQIVKRKLVTFQRMTRQNMASQKSNLKKSQEQSTQDGSKYNISSTLEKNIINYIKQSNSGSGNMEYQQRDELLAELPQHLRRGYFKQTNKRIFPSVLFFNRLKPSTVQQMAEKFENKFYYPGQYLMESSQKIMILEYGNIGYGYKKRGSQLNGQIFDSLVVKKDGYTRLLTSSFLSLYRTQNYQLIAKDYSLVWKISLTDFQQTIKQSSIDYQYYFSVLHKHTFDENQWSAVICPRCSSQNLNTQKYHVVFNCPRIVYLPLKQILIYRIISVSQSKICFRKKTKRSRNSYSKISTLMHKPTFNKLIQKLSCVKKTTQMIAQNMETQVLKYHEQDSIRVARIKQISNLDMTNLMIMIQKTIRKYDTGYEDGFWDLQVDSAHNYQFYFPNQNSNRLNSINVQDIGKNSTRIKEMKKYFKSIAAEQEDSIQILSS